MAIPSHTTPHRQRTPSPHTHTRLASPRRGARAAQTAGKHPVFVENAAKFELEMFGSKAAAGKAAAKSAKSAAAGDDTDVTEARTLLMVLSWRVLGRTGLPQRSGRG